MSKKQKGNGFGVASLICGIAGLCGFLMPYFAIFLSILAVVFSVIQKRNNPNGISTAGLVLGIIGIILNGLICLLLFLFMLPALML